MKKKDGYRQKESRSERMNDERMKYNEINNGDRNEENVYGKGCTKK